MADTTGHTGMAQHLSRRLIPLSTGIALLIALLAPITSLIHGHIKLQQMTTIYAGDLAEQLQKVALESPGLWKYQSYKFIRIVEGLHPSGEVSGFRILDEKGNLVTGHDYHKVSWQKPGEKLSLTEELKFTLGTAPVIFNGKRLGTVEVLADDRSILLRGALLFCFWSLTGIALALLVYRFPVIVVRGMEEKIESATAFSRTVMDSLTDAISIIDVSDYRIKGCNAVFLKEAGLAEADVVGRKCYELTHHLSEPCSPPSDTCPMKETVASGKYSVAEHLHFRGNGEKFYAEVSTSPVFDRNGKIASVVHVSRDITGRKRAEEEIQRLNAELDYKVVKKTRQLFDAQDELVRKEKMAVLGQLSGSVGHELRNPLGVMSNAVYFLKMAHADGDDITKEYLDIIKKEIDNSQRIITDLLDFARTKTPQTRPVTVRELLEGSIGKCVIPDTVNLQTEIPDLLPPLKIDPLQMEQVFQNLITNAVQAMPDGGGLRVAARFVGAGLAPAQAGYPPGAPLQDFIEISVIDTGEGISAENMKKLFQPLFTTKAKGIGLGLVVCRNLVEANGGRIEVESEAGKGTTFTVTLPASGE